MKVSKQETKKTFIQLVKYCVIGASNTVITLVSFWACNTVLGLPYVPSNAVGYVLGVVNSFVWNRTWVFKSKDNVWRQAALFVLGFLLCYGVQLIVSAFLLEACDMKHYELHWMKNAGQNIVMVASMAFYTLANYIYNRTITFHTSGKEQQDQQE